MGRVPVIRVDSLTHTFGQGETSKTVLQAVSADFFPGEIVIISGPSGAGKTTFLTIAGALRSVQQGSIRVDGTELAGADKATLMAVRRKIGFIFQAHNLIASLSVLQNVMLALAPVPGEQVDVAADKARRALENVGLGAHLHKLPRQLSGGQKQRVAIARALVRQPAIIMADEPTAALDSKTGREVVELLEHLAKAIGCTILMVTHDNRILDVADRIIRIEDGQIEEMAVGVERLFRQLTELARQLARFLSATDEERPSLEAAFGGRAKTLGFQLTDLRTRSLREDLASELEAIQGLLGALEMLMQCISELRRRVQGEPATAQLGDMLVQSLEFLLLTQLDVFTGRQAGDRETLAALTADRGEMMDRLRESYSRAAPGGGAELAAPLFELGQLFSRAVYLIHHVAQLLLRFTAAGKEAPTAVH